MVANGGSKVGIPVFRTQSLPCPQTCRCFPLHLKSQISPPLPRLLASSSVHTGALAALPPPPIRLAPSQSPSSRPSLTSFPDVTVHLLPSVTLYHVTCLPSFITR